MRLISDITQAVVGGRDIRHDLEWIYAKWFIIYDATPVVIDDMLYAHTDVTE